MNVEAFLICDAAAEQFGKLSLLGAFDTLFAAKAPVVHPQFSVALRIRFSKSESANHPFRINIIDVDGKSILPNPIDGNVTVHIQHADESAIINLIVNFRDVKFDKFGQHSIDLTISGKQRGSLPLFVKEQPKNP